MAAKVVKPAITSVLMLLPFSVTLKNRSTNEVVMDLSSVLVSLPDIADLKERIFPANLLDSIRKISKLAVLLLDLLIK